MKSLGLHEVAGRDRGIPEVRFRKSLERGEGIGRVVEGFPYENISSCFLSCHHVRIFSGFLYDQEVLCSKRSAFSI